jgi:DNA polymerase III subunit delta
MRAADLVLKPEARATLIPLLGGDRVASRNEIRKLALYARGRTEVGVNDVIAVVSDASELALDELIDAAFAGRPADVEAQLSKVRTAGTPVGSIFFAAQRQLAQLHRWRTMIEEGAPFSLDRLQPPLHFTRKNLVEAALKQWTAARLANAMAELAAAVLASRKTAALADTIGERALLSIAVKARRSAA